MTKSNTRYPGWPDTINDSAHFDRAVTVTKVPLGQGLLGSDLWPVIESAPDPVYVRQWRKLQNATVSKTAEYFGLSEVQVLKVTGNQ